MKIIYARAGNWARIRQFPGGMKRCLDMHFFSYKSAFFLPPINNRLAPSIHSHRWLPLGLLSKYQIKAGESLFADYSGYLLKCMVSHLRSNISVSYYSRCKFAVWNLWNLHSRFHLIDTRDGSKLIVEAFCYQNQQAKRHILPFGIKPKCDT